MALQVRGRARRAGQHLVIVSRPREFCSRGAVAYKRAPGGAKRCRGARLRHYGAAIETETPERCAEAVAPRGRRRATATPSSLAPSS